MGSGEPWRALSRELCVWIRILERINEMLGVPGEAEDSDVGRTG